MIERLNIDDYDLISANRAMTDAIARDLQAIEECGTNQSWADNVTRERVLNLLMMLVSLRPKLSATDYDQYLALIQTLSNAMKQGGGILK